MRVNAFHCPSRAVGSLRLVSSTDAPRIVSAAIDQGSQGTFAGRVTGAGDAGSIAEATLLVIAPLDVADNESSANARSLADWKRRSGAFSRQRRTMRSRFGEM